ncbi:MAG: hypothetical protein JWQ13_2439 [Ramlibacter sp.]|jgi:hypothetical protein|nr:hypothetical protein [Ramlibacter sp.]
MKNFALLTLALLAAGAANAATSPGADEFNEQNRSQFTSSLTRAEVNAQLADAIRNGQMEQYGEWTSGYAVNQQAGSGRDRGAVREEAKLAARTHTVGEGG